MRLSIYKHGKIQKQIYGKRKKEEKTEVSKIV